MTEVVTGRDLTWLGQRHVGLNHAHRLCLVVVMTEGSGGGDVTVWSRSVRRPRDAAVVRYVVSDDLRHWYVSEWRWSWWWWMRSWSSWNDVVSCCCGWASREDGWEWIMLEVVVAMIVGGGDCWWSGGCWTRWATWWLGHKKGRGKERKWDRMG